MNKNKKSGVNIFLTSLLAVLMLVSCSAKGKITPTPSGTSSGASSSAEVTDEFAEGTELKPTGQVDADADKITGIAIRTAEDLLKIGKAATHPIDGDYSLVADIDLSQIKNFTPIGGSVSECGIVEGKNVFSGTLDGRGHTIAGLTISVSSTERVHVGLFGSVGSAKPEDPAVIKNLILKDVNITGSAKGSATYAALAGQVDGYAQIDNIAILSGKVNIENESGDILGIGSLIGQCRTQAWTGCTNRGIHITNIFTNVTVTGDNNGNANYTSGLIGRIRASDLGTLSNVIQLGTATHEGGKGNAISGGDSGAVRSENVYYLTGTGKDTNSLGEEKSYESLTSGTITLDADSWHMEKGAFPLLNNTYNSPLFTVLDFVTITLADGETVDSVKSGFTLVDSVMGKTIKWKSSNEDVISISGNTASVTKPKLGYTDVTLTARADGINKVFNLRVSSGVKGELELDTETNTIIAKNYPTDVSFKWIVVNAATGKTVKTASTTEGKLELTDSMSNAMITLQVDGYDTVTYYNSTIPTVCITSDTAYYDISKSAYSKATLTVYTTARYPDTQYSGSTEIKLRGNSTAYQAKRPFRLKLAKKTDMFDMGESKHWVLLANAFDRSNLRNKLSYDLGMSLGLAGCESILVNVIFNGEYYGMYQFCENIRIDEGRVDIFDWEETAEDVAKAIAKKEGLSAAERDELEDKLTKNLTWVTTGKFGNYIISDYYDTSAFNINGGYLIENDYYYDEYSKFTTENEMKMMIKSPEYAATNKEMMNSIQSYIQAMEDAMYSPSRLNDEGKHYTEYMDLQSFLDFFMVNQLFKNVELFYKSCYMYKDVDSPLVFGPIWDMDWAAANHVNLGNGLASKYDSWKHDQSQDREYWYRALYNDPYFMILLCERWNEIQDKIDDMMEELDTVSAEIVDAAKIDNKRWGYDWTVEKEVSFLKTWLTNRRNWLSEQMATPETLIRSLDYYQDSKNIGITGFYEGSDFVELTITVLNEEKFKSCDLMINGVLVREVEITNGCKIRIEKSEFREAGKYNSIEILGKTAAGNYNTVLKRSGQRGSTMVDADFYYYLSK